MSNQSEPGDSGVVDAVDRLHRSIEHLETALAERDRWVAEEASRMEAMRAEAEALRSLQNTVAARLDAAIARLKTTIGD